MAGIRVYPAQCAYHLGEHEVKDFNINVSNEVSTGDSVSQASFSAKPSGELTFGVPVVNGTMISVIVSTPVAGTPYDVVCNVTTGTGKVFDVPFVIAGVDKTA